MASWDLGSLIDKTLSTAAAVGERNQAYREKQFRDAREKWQATLGSNEKIAGLGEAGALQRAMLQHGEGGSADRGIGGQLAAAKARGESELSATKAREAGATERARLQEPMWKAHGNWYRTQARVAEEGSPVSNLAARQGAYSDRVKSFNTAVSQGLLEGPDAQKVWDSLQVEGNELSKGWQNIGGLGKKSQVPVPGGEGLPGTGLGSTDRMSKGVLDDIWKRGFR